MLKNPPAVLVRSAATHKLAACTVPLETVIWPFPSRPTKMVSLVTASRPPATKTVPVEPLKRAIEHPPNRPTQAPLCTVKAPTDRESRPTFKSLNAATPLETVICPAPDSPIRAVPLVAVSCPPVTKTLPVVEYLRATLNSVAMSKVPPFRFTMPDEFTKPPTVMAPAVTAPELITNWPLVTRPTRVVTVVSPKVIEPLSRVMRPSMSRLVLMTLANSAELVIHKAAPSERASVSMQTKGLLVPALFRNKVLVLPAGAPSFRVLIVRLAAGVLESMVMVLVLALVI